MEGEMRLNSSSLHNFTSHLNTQHRRSFETSGLHTAVKATQKTPPCLFINTKNQNHVRKSA